MPSLATRAQNLASAVPALVQSAFKKASPDVFNMRLATCQACPSAKWDATAYLGSGGCLACGCSRAKLKFKRQSCPEGYWKEEPI